MTSLRLASFALVAALVPAATIIAQSGTGSPTPPPTRPGGGSGSGTGAGSGAGGGAGGGVGGPRVPGGAREGQRDFRGGEGRGGPRDGAAEDRVWMQALDKISSTLQPEQKTKIDGIRDNYKKLMQSWQEKNGAEMKELQKQLGEARKAGQKPDPAVAERLEKIAQSRPRIDGVKTEIAAVLTPEQLAAHKSAMEALAKEREGARPGRRGGDRPAGDGMDDGKSPPPGRGDRPPGRGKAPPPAGDKAPPADKPPTPPAN